MNTITLEIKTVYGNELFYPICDNSVRVSTLTGTKTLTKDHVTILKGLGFKVEFKIKSGDKYLTVSEDN